MVFLDSDLPELGVLDARQHLFVEFLTVFLVVGRLVFNFVLVLIVIGVLDHLQVFESLFHLIDVELGVATLEVLGVILLVGSLPRVNVHHFVVLVSLVIDEVEACLLPFLPFPVFFVSPLKGFR